MDELKNGSVSININETYSSSKNGTNNDPQTMIEICSQKIEQEPFHLKALLLRSGSYLKLKNYEKSLEDVETILQIDPHNSNNYHLKGCILEKLEKYQEAIDSLNIAIELNENNANALFLRAACHNKLDHIQESLEDYNLALEKDSMNFQSPNLYKNIDKVLEKEENFSLLSNFKSETLTPNELRKSNNSELGINFEKEKLSSPNKNFLTNLKKSSICTISKTKSLNLHFSPKSSLKKGSLFTQEVKEIKNLKNTSIVKSKKSINKLDITAFQSPQKKPSSIKAFNINYIDKPSHQSPIKLSITNTKIKQNNKIISPQVHRNQSMSLNNNIINKSKERKKDESNKSETLKINESTYSSSDENSNRHSKYEFFSPTLVKKSFINSEFDEYKNNLLLNNDLELEIIDQSFEEFRLDSEDDENEKLLVYALIEKKSHNYAKALELTNKYLQSNTKHNLKGLLFRGIIYLKTRLYSQAKEDLYKVLNSEPNNHCVLYNLAICHEKLKENENMKKFFDLAIEENPEEINYYMRRGFALQNIELYQDALLDYTKVISHDCNNALAYFNRGFCFEKLGNFKQAEINYDLALNIDKTNVKFLLHHAAILEKIGGEKNIQKSKNIYLKLLTIKPNYALVYNCLGGLLDRNKSYDEAMNYFNKALEVEPMSSVFWNNRGCCFRNQGKYHLALDDFNQAVRLETKPLYFDNRAYLLTKLDLFEKAIEDYSWILNNQGDDIKILFNRAFCYSKLNFSEKAIVDYLRIIDIEKSNDLAFFYIGIENQKLNRYQEAILYFSKSIDLNMKNFDAYNHRGKCYEKIGEFEKSIADFELIKRNKESH